MYLRRSKLEIHEAILGATIEPLCIDSLAYKVGIDCSSLKKHLSFLMQNGLIKEKDTGRRTIYTSTDRGLSVFRTLDLQKCLRKTQEAFIAINDASDAVRESEKDI
jgi:predicted transcriptional regulator